MDTILTRALVRGMVLNSSVHVCNRGTGCHSASYSSDEKSDVSVCTSMDTILTRVLVRGVVLNSSVHVCNGVTQQATVPMRSRMSLSVPPWTLF